MDQTIKDQVLLEARQHLDRVSQNISQEMELIRERLDPEAKKATQEKYESEELAMLEQAVERYSEKRLLELEKLIASPYFQRLDLDFAEHPAQIYYVGKFSDDSQNIISWTAPLASIRFESPGKASYLTPEHIKEECLIKRKDQFMIVDGKVIFMATESREQARELIYQDFFSSRKNTFALPEIVAQMEKAQDEVIRAEATGPFMITGPAGSGKTTLALHRVAYLTQSPDTARKYPSNSILVLVQDAGTKEYFSKLLPDLGITGVKITTFSEWSIGLLDLENFHYQSRIGTDETERDLYECAKITAIENEEVGTLRRGGEMQFLEKIYHKYFDESQRKLLLAQKKEKSLDRFDLSLLMQAKLNSKDRFDYMKEVNYLGKNGNRIKKVSKEARTYSLIIVDEFQNYLPGQINLFNTFLNPKNKSILYVGDLAQQTQFGTLHKEGLPHKEQELGSVRLQKVYRNKRRILEYLNSIGFNSNIPDSLPVDGQVEELNYKSEVEKLEKLRQKVAESAGNVGIICMNPAELAEIQKYFKAEKRVFVLSVREAQGVEFETVCLVMGKTEPIAEYVSALYQSEITKIRRDLLYVALTRAISNLYVFKRVDLD